MKQNLMWNGKISGIFGALILVIKSILHRVDDYITTLIVSKNFNIVGKNSIINRGITYRYPGNIEIGNNVTIARGVTLISENPFSKLFIDDNVVITFDVRLDFSGGVKIGKNTLISKNTIIETHDHDLDPHSIPVYKDLFIEDNVWIGMNSIILSDVRRIGSNSIIAAGSVVTKEVPKNVIVGGVPAKIIKKLND